MLRVIERVLMGEGEGTLYARPNCSGACKLPRGTIHKYILL